MKESVQKLFKNWDETIIWSCMQGIMGEIYTWEDYRRKGLAYVCGARLILYIKPKLLVVI